MTIGTGCFLGITYAAIFIGALGFKELRNEWSFLMLLATIGLGMFAISQLMVQLPWIILAIGVSSIPIAISMRIIRPVIRREPRISIEQSSRKLLRKSK